MGTLSDLNGTFKICHEIKIKKVEIAKDENDILLVHVRKTISMNDTNFMYMYVQRTEKVDVGLVRNIVHFASDSSRLDIVNDKVLLQYYIKTTVAGDVDEVTFNGRIHRNAKNDAISPSKEKYNRGNKRSVSQVE